MNGLERQPDQQVVRGQQNRSDRGQRQRHFKLDTGADARIGTDADAAFEAVGNLADHFETDTAAGDLAERRAGGYSRAENKLECPIDRQFRRAGGGQNSVGDGGATNGVDIDTGAVVGAGKDDSIRMPLDLKAHVAELRFSAREPVRRTLDSMGDGIAHEM